MKKRRVSEEIDEEENPFYVPKISSIDSELERLRKEEENEIRAGIHSKRIEEILKKVEVSIGMVN